MSFLSTVGSLFGWFHDNSTHDMDTHSYDDVCQVRAILKILRLPTELVLEILDHAQYWPQHEFRTSPEHVNVATSTMGASTVAVLCLDLSALNNLTVDRILRGGETPKVKSLEFKIGAHDQGWTSQGTTGTYDTSSWLEVSILRAADSNNTQPPGPTFGDMRCRNPSDFHDLVVAKGWFLVKRPKSAVKGPQDGEGDFAWYLQGNRVANPEDECRVVWTETGSEGNDGAGSGEGFVKELQDGDRVLVWARSKWGGWKCVVDSITVTVRYRL